MRHARVTIRSASNSDRPDGQERHGGEKTATLEKTRQGAGMVGLTGSRGEDMGAASLCANTHKRRSDLTIGLDDQT